MGGNEGTMNPWLFMTINMVVVFAVLAMLGLIMVITHKLDPTKKKSKEPVNVAPAAAPVTAAAPVVANDEPVVAAITGAIVAMGYSSDQIASIRPSETSRNWRLDGRLSGRI
ncbi:MULTISPECIES: OadG family protein [Veillonella]|uniref:Na+-transporting methylmalonyl-CoA/oxaloacetate decarboxylase, gamma subunit n=1 Tax=Veillonella criceti TaxID=103891 RepID=A0A380NQ40_9FIRM|nr:MULTISPECIES: OadG family protein [Veillonella]SUP44974.1 Na+-transporting methylmalonyl-CoA/oxaloacetate decarboxylase, gamma subunit [Veillonella criceti]